MDFQTAAKLLLSNSWTYAKTMPQHPHFYTLRKNWGNDEAFDQVVEFIRANSYEEKFYSKKYRMFLLNGQKYWTMGAPIDQTILINRADQKNFSYYDRIADQYDKMFHDPASVEEDHELLKMIDIKGKILDIGCGNGLFLDYFQPEPKDYVGIDPSLGMLNFFKHRHPEYAAQVMACRFEDFYGTGFSTILALYGTASYIRPDTIERIKGYLAPGGKAYLMFYKDGYTPVTHEHTGVEIPYYEAPAGGQIFHNYKMLIIE